MLAGDTRLDDYTTMNRPTMSEMFEKMEWERWPLMSWDVQGTYWLMSSWAGPVLRSGGTRKVVDVVLTSSVSELADNSRFSCDLDHEILCSDGQFRSIHSIMQTGAEIQHGRGMGHNVRVKSVKDRQHAEFVYSFSVDKFGCFCHSYVVHKAMP